MPKSFTRAPARLLVLAVALGGPLAVVTPADAATGEFVPAAPTYVRAFAGDVPGDATVVWDASALEPVDEPPVDEPPVDEPPVDEPPVDEPPVDEPPTDEPPVDEPPVDEPPVDEPPTDEPPTEEPPGDTTPGDPIHHVVAEEYVDHYVVVAFDEEGQRVEEAYLEVPAVDEMGDPAPTEAVIEDLPVGTFDFAVKAVEADGDESELTHAAEDVTIDYRLAPASDLQVATSPGTVELDWSAPEVPADRPAVTVYSIFLIIDGGEEDGDTGEYAQLEGDELATSHVFDDVPAGSYRVVIYTDDEAGDQSHYAAPGTVEVVGHTAPGAPEVTGAEQAYGRSGVVSVQWDAPEDDHGFTVGSYRVDLVSQETVPAVRTTPLPSRTIQVTDPDRFDYDTELTGVPAGTYDVVVTAISGETSSEDVLEGVEVVQLPNAVQGLTLRQVAPGKVVATWKAPIANGADIVGYGVAAPLPGAQSGGLQTVSTQTFSKTVSNLRPGRFRVYVGALTTYGTGDTQPGPVLSAAINVTNNVKAGAPTIKVKDAKLKRGQKLQLSGKAVGKANLQLEIKTARSADFLVLGSTRANAKGAYAFNITMPEAGTVRVVDAGTGRVSGNVKVVITKTGR